MNVVMGSPKMVDFFPVLILFAAALLALVTRGWLRGMIMLAAPMLAGYSLYTIELGLTVEASLIGLDVMPLRVDRLSLLFGYLFCVTALLGNIYALHHKDTMQHVAAQAYAGSAIGAVLAGDLLTLFIYWELMALTSSVLIFARRSDVSLKAGIRYLVMQIVSGLLLLAGVMLYFQSSGSLAFEHIGQHVFSLRLSLCVIALSQTDNSRCANQLGSVSERLSIKRAPLVYMAPSTVICWSSSAAGSSVLLLQIEK